MKRLFDILLSLLILALFLPIGILLIILVVIESKGGPFYFQQRVGLQGKLFYLLKFRSMRMDSDKGSQTTIGKRDARITRVVYFIRKFKLDEFPQFVNVLKGDMSIVGPRPEVPHYVAMYTAEQRKILSVKPGITDYASLAYFDENELLAQAENPELVYINEIMPAKLALNEKYLTKPNVWHDLQIIWLTAKKILRF